MRRLQLMGTVLLLLLILGLSASTAFSNPPPQESLPLTTPVPPPQGPGPLQPVIRYSTRNDTSPPLRSIPPLAPQVRPNREIPLHPLPWPEGVAPSEPESAGGDPVLQDWPGTINMPAPKFNFEGLSNNDNATAWGGLIVPPDTQGDVGPNHYVQWVNVVFAVWSLDRPTNTATLVYGPAAGKTLWTGFGGPCETTNDGDPITLYDHLADRWLMSQLALPNYPDGPFYQCIAISQSPDPTGTWHRYEFLISATKLNDYPKFGVWPDGYYMSVNQFDPGWAGVGVVAFERDEMLAGNVAQMVYFDLDLVDPNLWAMLPSDLDGPTPPPPGSPNYFVQFDDDGWGYPQDQLEIWQFQVDWVTPANSTFAHLGDLATVAFDSDMCGGSRNCIPQPGTTQKLDAISDRLMYRLQYRNFGTYETLVVNHTVDVGGDHAGIRWYELRDAGGGWSIYQQGTYAPDSDHRWMGSIAMDGAGNMALGYSVSSTTTYPSVRYVGRLAGDPLGTMPQVEVELIAGADSQEGANRWGDYSTMSVDPTDDCTFWYTQEYVAGPGSWNWWTRIGSFKFPSCGPTGTLQGTVTDASTGLPIASAQVDADGFTTFTNGSGFYQFLSLPVDTYDVTASASGYAPSTVSGVSVTDGGTTTQDFALTPLQMVYLPLVLKNYSPSAGWVTIMSEDFEGPFPGSWDVFDNEPGYGEYYWGKRNCRHYQGTYSGWGVGGGADGASLPCGSNYPDYASSWMIYGPFSLADATAADLQFKLWLKTEPDYDFVCQVASINGTYFYGSCTSGKSFGWIDKVLDLSDVYTLGNLMGQSQVWVALIFSSNSSINRREGGYVDNIVLRKCTSSSCPTAISEVEPIPEGAEIVERPAMFVLKP